MLGYSKRITDVTASFGHRSEGAYAILHPSNVLGSRGSMLGTFIDQIEASGGAQRHPSGHITQARCRRSSPPPKSPGLRGTQHRGREITGAARCPPQPKTALPLWKPDSLTSPPRPGPRMAPISTGGGNRDETNR